MTSIWECCVNARKPAVIQKGSLPKEESSNMGAIAAPIMIGLTAASTVSGYVGNRRAAKGAQAQGNYEGSILDQNAAAADAQAADAIARGAESVARSRAAGRSLTGSQRASMAAQGIDAGSGSAADVISNDQTLGEFDALTISQNAQREAWGFKVEAANDRGQANLARMGGRNQAASYRNQAVGTLLSGSAQLYDLYHSFGKTTKPTVVDTSRAGASNGSYVGRNASR